MDFSAITAVQRQEADRKPRLMGLRAGTGSVGDRRPWEWLSCCAASRPLRDTFLSIISVAIYVFSELMAGK